MMDDTINKDQKDYQISVSKVYPVWNESYPMWCNKKELIQINGET